MRRLATDFGKKAVIRLFLKGPQRPQGFALLLLLMMMLPLLML